MKVSNIHVQLFIVTRRAIVGLSIAAVCILLILVILLFCIKLILEQLNALRYYFNTISKFGHQHQLVKIEETG